MGCGCHPMLASAGVQPFNTRCCILIMPLLSSHLQSCPTPPSQSPCMYPTLPASTPLHLPSLLSNVFCVFSTPRSYKISNPVCNWPPSPLIMFHEPAFTPSEPLSRPTPCPPHCPPFPTPSCPLPLPLSSPCLPLPPTHPKQHEKDVHLRVVLGSSGISKSSFQIIQVWRLVHKASKKLSDFYEPCTTTCKLS